MASLADNPGRSAPTEVARRFLDSLAAQDFERLASQFSDDVRLRALLPGDTKEWEGPERVTRTFARWFGDTVEYDLVDATVEDLGPRLHLSWQARMRADRLGEGWFRVTQHAYVDTDEVNRIEHLWLTCSGYLAELPAD